MKLDQTQLRILSLLQKDSTLSTQALADKVGMSPSPCWRRVKEMEEAGLIRGYVALVDRQKLGLGTCVWVRVKLKQHSADVLDRFEQVVKGCNEVVECYELLGETDCLLKLYLPSLEAFSSFMHNFLLKIPEIDVTHSSVALREIKNETALPL
ncbi:MAG: AsnC family transcriptional regulator [Betaproteobacteria bacterium HGW-Betaproteobacteria-13]|jgi:DNA-binding Lrp family transcriptional regulator|uniref:AsnC family transcriptional regulator n=1 Tax=Parazoarcus communis TaxID=41977 RepID=A0A2U8GXH3_9RHOO|nr:Lrp/AsnC family transcriptional regulator [Parazoarcus communis]AWI78100.1 AsnC family transcriptional regulator [Parazoarcus communis]PKO59937.1 MAG: AsnC family transcriptional regulator [Betaproteobacteria bacterium HGW-Betaproteobacteria-19]PKO81052.1 MAG: AsnC family transcriptional regulator [Betaproteobacteria bacterium HGW-Betaproteobacteria-13]|tara:strand:- start:67941 stop:68399 length:459 start_codon:yes stop_codon:yes gene_type:complete